MWDLNVVVNVLLTRLAQKVKTFGLVNLMSEGATFASDEYKIYTKNSTAQSDDELDAATKAAVAACFSQKKHGGKFMVSKKDADAAQSDNFLVAGTWAENDVARIEVLPYGETTWVVGEFTCGASETPDTVAAGLRADLTTELSGFTELTVGGTGANATVTTADAGEGFGSKVGTLVSSAGTITKSVLQANINYATELTDLVALYPDWYGLLIASRDKQDILWTAEWVDSNARMFGYQTSDAEVLAGTADNVMDQLKSLSRWRSFGSWHADDAENCDVAWLVRFLAANPDTTSTIAAYKELVGVTANDGDVTDAELEIIKGYNGNCYGSFYGYDVPNEGKLADGNFIDTLLARDWLEARIKERIALALVNQSNLDQVVPFTQTGMDFMDAQVEAIFLNALNIGHIASPDGVQPAYVIQDKQWSEVTDADKAARKYTNKGEVWYRGAIQAAEFEIAVIL